MKNAVLTPRTNTLYLDQTSNRLAVAYVLNNTSIPSLALSKKVPWRVSANSLRCTLHGNPAKNLFSMIGASENRILWNSTEVVFGISVDPFQDSFAGLGEALKSIEFILQNNPKKLYIQTRSPLVLLATPLLRSTANVEIRMALETVEDEVARRLLPSLPRPSERLTAFETLTDAGFATALQVSPVIPKQQSGERVSALVSRLNEIRARKIIRPIESLLTNRPEVHLRLLAKSQQLLLVQADRILAHELSNFEERAAKARA